MNLAVNGDKELVIGHSESDIKPFKWNKTKMEAARLIAEDELTINRVSVVLKITAHSIQNWLRHPQFKARIEHLKRAFEASIMARGIANKARRIDALNDLHERQKAVINHRVGTHDSGLLVTEPKYIPDANGGSVVELEVYDAALTREYRATLSQAAEETGQLVTRNEISGPGGGPIQLSISVLDDIVERVRAAKLRRNKEAIDVLPVVNSLE